MIPQKFGQIISEVSEAIKNYKRMVRSLLKYISKKAAKTKRKTENDELEEIVASIP